MRDNGILLDTTGSMAEVLPVVKNSVIKLIDAMSDGDSVLRLREWLKPPLPE